MNISRNKLDKVEYAVQGRTANKLDPESNPGLSKLLSYHGFSLRPKYLEVRTSAVAFSTQPPNYSIKLNTD